MDANDDRRDASDSPDSDDPATVLEIFGIELKVRNERLAEVLTMEAGEALATDVRELLDPDVAREVRAELSEALPDVVLSPTRARDESEAKARLELRSRADAVAEVLGFDPQPGGVWRSPTGLSVITRVVEHPPSLASATDLADKFASVLADAGGPDASALLIVDSQQTADVCKVAIRQRRLYDVMRTISLDNLEEIRVLFTADAIDHTRALVLLSPLADIDVGEVLSIVRSAASGSGEESRLFE